MLYFQRPLFSAALFRKLELVHCVVGTQRNEVEYDEYVKKEPTSADNFIRFLFFVFTKPLKFCLIEKFLCRLLIILLKNSQTLVDSQD